MKALITGASGFVGSHLARELVAAGWEVRALLRPTSNRAPIAGLPLEIVLGDLEDEPALERAAAGVDLVFHVAGRTRARSAAEYDRVNAAGTRRLCSTVLRIAPSLKRLVYLSSLAAAGPAPGPEPLRENAPPRPADDYGRSKYRGELAVRETLGHIPATILRPPGVYGPGDRNFLPLYRTAQRWRFVPAVGGRKKRFSLIYVKDLVRGIRTAALSEQTAGKTYFLTGGDYTPEDVAAALSAALGIPLRTLVIPAPAARALGECGELLWKLTGRSQIVSRRKIRDLLHPWWICDGRAAARDFGFIPEFDLTAGLRETVAWCRSNGLL